MTTERKNISLTLSVPVDTRKKLRQLAVDQDRSLSEIVIELIDEAASRESRLQAQFKRTQAKQEAAEKAAQEAVDNANHS